MLDQVSFMLLLLLQVVAGFPASFRTTDLKPACASALTNLELSYLGSCTTVAVAAFSARLCYQQDVQQALSVQYALNCMNAGPWGGGMAVQAWEFLRTRGVPFETCVPYSGPGAFCNTTCADGSQAQLLRPQGYQQFQGVPSIQMAILQGGAVQACMDVYKDFGSYEGGEVYTHKWGGYENYSCVLLIGWQDNAWRAYVPWQSDMGYNGEVLIQMGACRIENDVWGASPL